MQSFFRACKALPRLLRHRWYEGEVRRVFPEKLLQDLAARVQASERQHTGQIRIAIEGGLPWSYLRRGAPPRERAVMLFGKLRVWDTEHNSGVLIYLLLADHAIEIVSDRGLAQRVPAQKWQEIIARMAATFRAGQYAQGLALAIDEVHALLVQHFPAQGGEARANELPDRPVII